MIPLPRFQNEKSRNQFRTALLPVILIGLYLSACTASRVTATPGIIPTLVTSLPATSISATVAPSDTPAVPTLTPVPSATPPSVTPPSPTPSCGAPAGWVRYTIRPGDNLFRLGLKTGVTVEEIKFANCLVTDDILAGAPLYLPFIPPVDTAVPPQPAATSGCPSVFNCSASALPALSLGLGGPNDPGFMPCSTSDGNPKGFPWISLETENLGSNDLEHGQRAYYFACEFSDPSTITAQMMGPGGIQNLSVLTVIPNPDLQMNTAQRVIPWNATCDLPTGSYLLNVRDKNGKQSQLRFDLTETSFERILTIPQSGPPGTSFQIYYCGYSAQANQQVLLDFYYGVKRTDEQGGYDFNHIGSWNILINAQGWAVQTLQSSSGDPARSYLIDDHAEELKGYDLIWLSP